MNSKIERRGSGFVVNVEGDIVPTYAYCSYQPEKARYEDFKEVGVKIISTAVYTGERGINQGSGVRAFRYGGFWKAEDVFDFDIVEKDFKRVVGNSKPGEVYILPRLMLEPPAWWEDQHPEEYCLTAQGTSVHCSFSSDKWLEACETAMNAFQKFILENGWDRYVIGWHVAAGNTEEFIRPELHYMQFMDYSEVSRKSFAKWLEDKYENIDKLNYAWNTRMKSFDEVTIPSPAERAYSIKGDIRDGEKELRTIDFYRFYSREVSSFAQKLVKVAKKVTGGKQIVGVFYGNMQLNASETAHNDFAEIMRDPEIDFAASPFAYSANRAQGIHWGFQAALECANLHGKAFFVEADVRTHLSRPLSECMQFADPYVNRAYDGPVWIGPDSVQGSLGQLTKAFSEIMTHGAAMWWFDMWGGWYNHEQYMDFMKKAGKIYEDVVLNNNITTEASVAVFVDEDALNHISYGASHLSSALTQSQMVKLGATGAMHHTYMLTDLPEVDPDKYRVAMLMFPAKLTNDMRAALEKWRSKGRTVLQIFLPDYYGFGVEVATGFKTVEEDGDVCVNATYRGEAFLGRDVVMPNVKIVPEYGDIVLVKTNGGDPAVIMRRNGDYQEILSLVPNMPASLLRDIILISGGHVYSFGGDPVSANSRYVSIHAASDGVKRLYIPRKGKLRDAFTGEFLPGNETHTDFVMKFGDTRLFEIVYNE